MAEALETDDVEIVWSVDSDARVEGPRYHDGNLASLRIDRRDVEVVVDVVGGGQTCFRFRHAEFGGIGVVSNAIIADVFAFSIHKSDHPGPQLSEAIHVWNGGMVPLGDLALQSGFMLRHHEEWLVLFTCSYGGAFSILCDKMTVTRRGY